MGCPSRDAVVRFLGQGRPRPLPVDASGAARQGLLPGTWVRLVTSETYGVGERTFEVPDVPELTEVNVVLSPASSGTADVAVRVVDPAGNPISGARVEVAGSGATTTEAAWWWLAEWRLAWPRSRWRPTTSAARSAHIAVGSGGEQVVTLDWVPTTLRIKTQLTGWFAGIRPRATEGGPATLRLCKPTVRGTPCWRLCPVIGRC